MALQTKVPTYTRVRYFKGLFLYAPDFDAESDFHVATRRHLNYLLFQPGVLLLGETDLEDNQGPFAVRADGSTAVTVSAGSAIVPDGDVRQQQHEVHLDAATTLNLSSTNVGALDGEKVFVTIGFDEEDVYSGLSSDGTSLTTEEDRKEEQAVLGASVTAPAAGDAAILLAEVTYRTAGIAAGDVTDQRVRGGLRYEILSQDLIDRLGAVTVPPPTIAGIEPTTGDPDTDFDVEVTGANLTGVTAVTFVPAAGLTVTDRTEHDGDRLGFHLAIADSAAAGPRNFRVMTPGGTARSEDFGLAFEVAAVQAAPIIEAVDPASGTQGTDFEVEVTGANLTGVTGVAFEPTAGLTVSDLTEHGDTRLSFHLEIADSAAAGGRTLRVTTDAGTASAAFEVTAAQQAPLITGIQPQSGTQGTDFEVEVTGSNLAGVTSLGFVPPAGLIVTLLGGDDTRLRFHLEIDDAAAIGARTLRVTTDGGTASVPFEIIAAQQAPVITGIQPQSGTQGTDFEVEVTGSNLAGVTSLGFVPPAGLIVTLLGGDDTRLRFHLEIDDAAAIGARTLRVTTDGGTASVPFTITAARVLQSITIASARSAIAESGDQVQLTATGRFSDGTQDDLTTQVSWTSSQPATATVDSNGVVTSAAAGMTNLQASFTVDLNTVSSDLLLLVVGVPVIVAWPTDADRRARGTETLRIFGDHFADPLEVAFRNAVAGDPVVAEGEAVSLTEARVVVPGPFRPNPPSDPALVRSGRIRVTTEAGQSENSPQNFILETL